MGLAPSHCPLPPSYRYCKNKPYPKSRFCRGVPGESPPVCCWAHGGWGKTGLGLGAVGGGVGGGGVCVGPSGNDVMLLVKTWGFC